ncbi:MAG: DUF4440 domain-containing protein [Bacteroidales bacterium]
MKKTRWYPILLLIIIILQISCNSSNQKEKLVRELMETDIDFSNRSLESGMNEAFLSYIGDDCVLLRPNRNPIIGRSMIEEFFSRPDTSFTLSWEPLHAEVSASGDFGYTYGIFTANMYSPEGELVTRQGTYANVWKKDKDGRWKFILDTGNQGIGK